MASGVSQPGASLGPKLNLRRPSSTDPWSIIRLALRPMDDLLCTVRLAPMAISVLRIKLDVPAVAAGSSGAACSGPALFLVMLS